MTSNSTANGAARRGRWTFVALMAVFFVPLLAAVAWFFIAPRFAPRPDAHGTLIEPVRPLEAFELAREGAARPFTLEDLRGKWTLLHVVDSSCRESCRERLYFTRQVHTALDKDQQRVQRVLLAEAGRDTPGLGGVLAAHPRLTVVAAGAGKPLRRQLPADLEATTVLLIDPHGNLMLRFDAGVEPEGILEDLEKLLKLSRIG